MLLYLLEQEEVSKQAVRKSEAEVRAILAERAEEDLRVNLEVDLFDTLRNQEAHQLRLDLERAAEEERTRCKEVELDYLAPFLAQIEVIGGKLTREQAFGLREECLQDFKQRLITKANIIQARFERETDKLQKKQQWYQLNQINLTKDDEQEYLQFCNDATFRITTLETMLAKHKETAPQRYMDLEKKLRSDPRLSEFLQAG
ncbi:Dynein regulatory complex subunit 7 [Paragonimus heterotremus]|uniref:Dynein regulatory complex subunit 7 n=1 Tax=Paragonimus heterotremus TaxID=100268 RepID=A0A8J4SPW8_9TREM|nr:Dynein regulatory complex subunit 7 [Paragonimus heterotremus]